MTDGWPKRPEWPEPWPKIPVDEGIECPKCKMKWKGVMGYCCPDAKCPIQPKATF